MFSRISVPTPFQIGPVNTYIAGRTVVDPGPDSEEAWSTILEALESRDLTPEDVEQVLITHPHPDHFGVAHRLQDAGAHVVASEGAADILADFAGRLEYEQEFFTPFFERCGVSAETAQTVTSLPESFLPYAPDVEPEETVTTGDSVEVVGTTLDVQAVQGHSAGEIIFEFDDAPAADEPERHAIVGDNVLPEITPNPFLLPPPEPGEPRPRVLPGYNDSLDRLAERQFDHFLPGHRGELTDPTGRIHDIRAAHEERTGNVRDLVDGPTTPVEVMNGLFGDLPVTEYFSGLSEAVGHLDVLERRDEVAVQNRGGVLVYERT
jgi:glyoxylase-like metal-dependent hydrolase (beta-lactamase superfamily II)